MWKPRGSARAGSVDHRGPGCNPAGSLANLVTPTYRRFLVVQDTGAAIKGARADLFFGAGREAEAIAGRTNERGRLYVLTPGS